VKLFFFQSNEMKCEVRNCKEVGKYIPTLQVWYRDKLGNCTGENFKIQINFYACKDHGPNDKTMTPTKLFELMHISSGDGKGWSNLVKSFIDNDNHTLKRNEMLKEIEWNLVN
jgi:hypothetical protein